MVMKSFAFAIAAFMSTTLIGAAAFAETQNDSLAKLHLLYLVGVEAGNIGQAKGCKEPVKKFSLRMSGNYNFANKKLRDFADQNKFSLNTPQFTQNETQNIERLQSEFGRIREINDCSFDKQYLSILKDAHKFAIGVANSVIAQESGKVKGFLTSALPLLKSNLAEIEQMSK